MTPNDETRDLIERFLAETGDVTGSSADMDWHEAPLPPGHRSGFIAVLGRPNVGKSTLINTLIGEKVSIVSPKPQTTRTRIMGILTREDYQLVFVDTPGIHRRAEHRLGQQLNENALAAIPDADVILFVVDVSRPPHADDERVAEVLRAKATKRPVIFVLNKMDQLSMDKAEAHINAYWALYPDYADSMPVSALKGTNVERLLEHILRFIPEGPRYFPPDQISDQTERQIAAELIREAAWRYTRQEIPHALAVIIEEYIEQANGVTHITATLWVERDSQKPILIGKGGEMLKRIGTAARHELERFIGGQVYLELWVKVRPKWRNSERDLKEAGVIE